MSRRPVGHVQDLGGGRWRLYAPASADPVTGKRRTATKRVQASSRRAALNELARFVAEVDRGTVVRGTTERTVEQLLAAWLENHRPNIAKNTYAEWQGCIRRYLVPHSGAAVVGKVTAYDLDALYRKLSKYGALGRGKPHRCPACGERTKVERGTRTGTMRACENGHSVSVEGRPLDARSVRECHLILNQAFTQAVKWQWRQDNPVLSASPPKKPRREPSPPDDADVVRLLQEAERVDPDWWCFLRVGAALGVRRGEGCGLQWPDVNLERAELAIRRVVIVADGKAEVRGYPKTKSSRRTVGLDPGTVEALRALRHRQKERALLFGTRPVRHGYVFSDAPDASEFWHPQVVTRRFTRLRDRLGLRTVRFHDLRAYMATQWIADGVDVRTVAGRGGWANANTLLTRYAAWLPARDREAAEQMGAKLDALLKGTEDKAG